MAKILVIAEHEAGQLEILVIGQELSGIAELLRSYRASAVLLADHAQLRHPVSDKYAQVIAELVKQRGITMVAAAASTFFKDVLRRAAALLDAGMLSDVTDCRLEGDEFIFKRVMFAGNIIATVKLGGPIKFLTIRPAAFAHPEKGPESSPRTPINVEMEKLPAFIEYGGCEAK